MQTNPALSSIETEFLNSLTQKQSRVSVFLVNGIRLKGTLIGHDNEAVCIEANGTLQMIYKKCVSTIQQEIELAGYDKI